MKIKVFLTILISGIFIHQSVLANDQCVNDILNANLPLDTREKNNEKLTKIPEANLFFDHSLNMKGFITPSQSAFKKFVTALNSKIAIVSENQVFYKYTYGIKGIQPNSVGKITSSEKFYQCPLASDQCPKKRAKLSKILKVVEKKEGSLLIIVTDLFIGMDELIGKGINQIRNPLAAALARGDSIGVYGVKSAFEGSISGICSGNSYNLATSRPFYVFTIGPKEHVLALKQIMDKDVISKIGEENVNFNIYTNDIIISPYVSNKWPNSTFELVEGVTQTNIYGEGANAYQFSINKYGDPLSIKINLEDVQTPYTLPVKSLYTEVITYQQRRDSGSCEESWIEYDKRDNVVFLKEQNNFEVVFNMFDKSNPDSLSLKRRKNYLFDIDFKAKSIGNTSDDFWMNNWSFVCDEINNYIESGTTFFPTLNLSSFGSNLVDVQSENFDDQVISQMNMGVYLER